MRSSKGFALPIFFTLLALVSGIMLVWQWHLVRDRQLTTIAEVQEVFWLWQQHVTAYYLEQGAWPESLEPLQQRLLNPEGGLLKEIAGSVVTEGYQLTIDSLPDYVVEAIVLTNPLFREYADGLAIITPPPPDQTAGDWVHLGPAIGTQNFMVELNASGYDVTDANTLLASHVVSDSIAIHQLTAGESVAQSLSLGLVEISESAWNYGRLDLASDVNVDGKLTLADDLVTSGLIRAKELSSERVNAENLQTTHLTSTNLFSGKLDGQVAQVESSYADTGQVIAADTEIAQIDQLAADHASITKLNVARVVAPDYMIPGTSLNTNHQRIETLYHQLYDCMYKTFHCMNLIAPVISAKCGNCISGFDPQGFRLIISLDVEGCRLYCETSWTLPLNTQSDCETQTNSIYKQGSFRCEIRYYGYIEGNEVYKSLVRISVFQTLNPLKRTTREIPVLISKQAY
ncbi:hypothetical protein SAMN06297229_0967 [Pseudidiomarina planktonica]|uniref:Uncharacterized protein n=1 Tax=Pseudidiomarina planktonica TaxID=1323738 RepID=A0A1Y6EN95_9GAMM|nr:hypothetical protein [Pseudidiomarina planktonica]RUO65608.1 hypothetical protein CWI77_03925 [Pseudidiomarina planktonica]SMQ64128.1 hypothetical protein SAMN06297229_0967 [Pseudidiomarina planktonica]